MEYGHFPVGEGVDASNEVTHRSYTFGWDDSLANNSTEAGNSDLLAILRATTNLPNGEPVTVNLDHAHNPRKYQFIHARLAPDNRSSGVGLDGNYRDPWGNPFVITLDLDRDGFCLDPVYSQPAVGLPTGLRDFSNPVRTNWQGRLELPCRVLIWSRGPDGNADPTIRADQGVNQDNVLSWE
jgi:hypothetical protein